MTSQLITFHHFFSVWCCQQGFFVLVLLRVDLALAFKFMAAEIITLSRFLIAVLRFATCTCLYYYRQ